MSRVAVVGTGYVGLTTAACFADLGNEVIGVDTNVDVVRMLQGCRVPFFEPGLQEMITRNAGLGRLHFTDSYDEAIPPAEFVFLAVGTPMAESGEADLSYVREAAASIGRHLTKAALIVNKSTVPIGTGDLVSDIVHENLREPMDVPVVSNPEFLREGSALHDFLQPDRIVIGCHDPAGAHRVAELYKALDAPILVTKLYTAEMIKYASNAFLATKISFINEIARVCEKLDADVKVVGQGMGMDARIGPAFLDAGLGYGGSCFPKDVQALISMSESIGAHPQMLKAVTDINNAQPAQLVDKLHDVVGPLRGLTIGVLGLSFKPNTDDMREAPSCEVIGLLLKRGATVKAYDPAAMDKARPLLPDVTMVPDAYAAATDSDAVILVTEWNEFRQLDLGRLKRVMRRPVLLDGRNLYEPGEVSTLGFVHKGVGR